MKSVLVILGCLVTTIAAMTTVSYTECGDSDHYGTSGVINSPNYPNDYAADLNCDYFVHAATGSSLLFIFKDFNTEPYYDLVTISCPSNSSFPPRQFSGWSLPNPIAISHCSQGLVNFQSGDDRYTSTGFLLDYYVNSEACGDTTFSYPYGAVYSPDFPDYYGYNQNCSNIIWAPEISTFSLFFLHFQLEYNCSADWLEISCLQGSPSGPYRYCGNNTNTTLDIYGCSQVLLWFHSDNFNEYTPLQGFDIIYSVHPDDGPEVTKDDTTGSAGATTGSIDPVCGESAYYGSYGVITSPNYPGNYYNNLYCDYYVYAETGSSLSFVFNWFYTETCCDYVTISCTSNSNFPPHNYSGDWLPEAFSISPCSQARINFRTDYSVVSSGFSVDYYVSDAGCGTTVYTGVNGFVNSPNWPEFYGYNKNCSNIIWTPQQSSIQLNFRSFNLQDDCNSDWLEISCLDNSEVDLRRFCGNNNNYQIYIQQCSQVLLWFHSDDTSNAQGFLIEYTIYPEQTVSSNGKPLAAENAPSRPNGKPNAEEKMKTE